MRLPKELAGLKFDELFFIELVNFVYTDFEGLKQLDDLLTYLKEEIVMLKVLQIVEDEVNVAWIYEDFFQMLLSGRVSIISLQMMISKLVDSL